MHYFERVQSSPVSFGHNRFSYDIRSRSSIFHASMSNISTRKFIYTLVIFLVSLDWSCRIDNCYCFEQLEEDFTNRVNHTTVVWFWKRWTRERRRNTFRNLLRKPINFESNHARLVRFVVHANRSDSYRVSFETLIIGVVPIRIDCLTAHIHTAFLWIIQYTVSGPVHRVSPLPSLFAPCPYITEESFYSSRVIIINKRPTGVF